MTEQEQEDLQGVAQAFIVAFQNVPLDADQWARREAVADAWDSVMLSREFADKTLPASMIRIFAQYIDGDIPLERLRRVFTAWSSPKEDGPTSMEPDGTLPMPPILCVAPKPRRAGISELLRGMVKGMERFDRDPEFRERVKKRTS